MPFGLIAALILVVLLAGGAFAFFVVRHERAKGEARAAAERRAMEDRARQQAPAEAPYVSPGGEPATNRRVEDKSRETLQKSAEGRGK